MSLAFTPQKFTPIFGKQLGKWLVSRTSQHWFVLGTNINTQSSVSKNTNASKVVLHVFTYTITSVYLGGIHGFPCITEQLQKNKHDEAQPLKNTNHSPNVGYNQVIQDGVSC